MRQSLRLAGASFAAFFFASFAYAQSSRTVYDYDSLGRLVQVYDHSNSSDFAEQRDYRFDHADNRTQVDARDNVRRLFSGEQWVSDNGQFRLVMQSDSNLVLYQDGTALWASGTYGSDANRAVMQADRNFVLHTASGTPIWSFGTFNNHCARIRVQDDGNLVVYSKNGAGLWATGTGASYES